MAPYQVTHVVQQIAIADCNTSTITIFALGSEHIVVKRDEEAFYAYIKRYLLEQGWRLYSTVGRRMYFVRYVETPDLPV